MEFSTHINFLGKDLSNNFAGIEIANYKELDNLKIDSYLIENKIIDLTVQRHYDVCWEEIDPYKIVIDTVKNEALWTEIRNNKLDLVIVFNVTCFKYAELVFELYYDRDMEEECWCIYSNYDQLKTQLTDEQLVQELISLKNNHKLLETATV